MSLITLIGGFSAATAMVIVETVALAIMVSNDIVMPVILRRRLVTPSLQNTDYTQFLLRVRRTAIFAVLLAVTPITRRSIAQRRFRHRPPLLCSGGPDRAVTVRRARLVASQCARGDCRHVRRFFMWLYFLFLPSFGLSQNDVLAGRILAFLFPGTEIFNGPVPTIWSTRRCCR